MAIFDTILSALGVRRQTNNQQTNNRRDRNTTGSTVQSQAQAQTNTYAQQVRERERRQQEGREPVQQATRQNSTQQSRQSAQQSNRQTMNPNTAQGRRNRDEIKASVNESKTNWDYINTVIDSALSHNSLTAPLMKTIKSAKEPKTVQEQAQPKDTRTVTEKVGDFITSIPKAINERKINQSYRFGMSDEEQEAIARERGASDEDIAQAKQAFAMNIDYINRNAQHGHTYEKMVENQMRTAGGLPMDSWLRFLPDDDGNIVDRSLNSARAGVLMHGQGLTGLQADIGNRLGAEDYEEDRLKDFQYQQALTQQALSGDNQGAYDRIFANSVSNLLTGLETTALGKLGAMSPNTGRLENIGLGNMSLNAFGSAYGNVRTGGMGEQYTDDVDAARRYAYASALNELGQEKMFDALSLISGGKITENTIPGANVFGLGSFMTEAAEEGAGALVDPLAEAALEGNIFSPEYWNRVGEIYKEQGLAGTMQNVRDSAIEGGLGGVMGGVMSNPVQSARQIATDVRGYANARKLSSALKWARQNSDASGIINAGQPKYLNKQIPRLNLAGASAKDSREIEFEETPWSPNFKDGSYDYEKVDDGSLPVEMQGLKRAGQIAGNDAQNDVLGEILNDAFDAYTNFYIGDPTNDSDLPLNDANMIEAFNHIRDMRGALGYGALMSTSPKVRKDAQDANAFVVWDSIERCGADGVDNDVDPEVVNKTIAISNRVGIPFEFLPDEFFTMKDGSRAGGWFAPGTRDKHGLRTGVIQLPISAANDVDEYIDVFLHEVTHSTEGTPEYYRLANALREIDGTIGDAYYTDLAHGEDVTPEDYGKANFGVLYDSKGRLHRGENISLDEGNVIGLDEDGEPVIESHFEDKESPGKKIIPMDAIAKDPRHMHGIEHYANLVGNFVRRLADEGKYYTGNEATFKDILAELGGENVALRDPISFLKDAMKRVTTLDLSKENKRKVEKRIKRLLEDAMDASVFAETMGTVYDSRGSGQLKVEVNRVMRKGGTPVSVIPGRFNKDGTPMLVRDAVHLIDTNQNIPYDGVHEYQIPRYKRSTYRSGSNSWDNYTQGRIDGNYAIMPQDLGNYSYKQDLSKAGLNGTPVIDIATGKIRPKFAAVTNNEKQKARELQMAKEDFENQIDKILGRLPGDDNVIPAAETSRIATELIMSEGKQAVLPDNIKHLEKAFFEGTEGRPAVAPLLYNYYKEQADKIEKRYSAEKKTSTAKTKTSQKKTITEEERLEKKLGKSEVDTGTGFEEVSADERANVETADKELKSAEKGNKKYWNIHEDNSKETEAILASIFGDKHDAATFTGMLKSRFKLTQDEAKTVADVMMEKGFSPEVLDELVNKRGIKALATVEQGGDLLFNPHKELGNTYNEYAPRKLGFKPYTTEQMEAYDEQLAKERAKRGSKTEFEEKLSAEDRKLLDTLNANARKYATKDVDESNATIDKQAEGKKFVIDPDGTFAGTTVNNLYQGLIDQLRDVLVGRNTKLGRAMGAIYGTHTNSYQDVVRYSEAKSAFDEAKNLYRVVQDLKQNGVDSEYFKNSGYTLADEDTIDSLGLKGKSQDEIAQMVDDNLTSLIDISDDKSLTPEQKLEKSLALFKDKQAVEEKTEPVRKTEQDVFEETVNKETPKKKQRKPKVEQKTVETEKTEEKKEEERKEETPKEEISEQELPPESAEPEIVTKAKEAYGEDGNVENLSNYYKNLGITEETSKKLAQRIMEGGNSANLEQTAARELTQANKEEYPEVADARDVIGNINSALRDVKITETEAKKEEAPAKRETKEPRTISKERQRDLDTLAYFRNQEIENVNLPSGMERVQRKSDEETNPKKERIQTKSRISKADTEVASMDAHEMMRYFRQEEWEGSEEYAKKTNEEKDAIDNELDTLVKEVESPKEIVREEGEVHNTLAAILYRAGGTLEHVNSLAKTYEETGKIKGRRDIERDILNAHKNVEDGKFKDSASAQEFVQRVVSAWKKSTQASQEMSQSDFARETGLKVVKNEKTGNYEFAKNEKKSQEATTVTAQNDNNKNWKVADETDDFTVRLSKENIEKERKKTAEETEKTIIDNLEKETGKKATKEQKETAKTVAETMAEQTAEDRQIEAGYWAEFDKAFDETLGSTDTSVRQNIEKMNKIKFPNISTKYKEMANKYFKEKPVIHRSDMQKNSKEWFDKIGLNGASAWAQWTLDHHLALPAIVFDKVNYARQQGATAIRDFELQYKKEIKPITDAGYRIGQKSFLDSKGNQLQEVKVGDTTYKFEDIKAIKDSMKEMIKVVKPLEAVYQTRKSDAARILATPVEGATETPLYTATKFENWIRRLNKQLESKGKKTVTINEDLLNDYILESDEKKRHKIWEDLMTDVGNQLPHNAVDMLHQWRMTSMLFNLPTQTRNFFGNSGSGAMFVGSNVAATMMEKAAVSMGKMTEDQRMHSIKFAKDSMKFAKQYRVESGYVDDVSKDDRFNMRMAQMLAGAFPNDNFFGRLLNKKAKATTAMLEWGDDIFIKPEADFHMASALSAQGYTIKQENGKYVAVDKNGNEISKEAMDKIAAHAKLMAEEATYHDFNKFAEDIKKWKENHKVLGEVVDVFQPYIKTPANILRRAIEFSPQALVVNGIYGAYQVSQGKMDANTYINKLAKGTTGLALALLGAFFKNRGLLVKGAPDDDDDEEEYYRENIFGLQPWSLHIGDSYYSLDWLLPFASPFLIGADYADTFQKHGINVFDWDLEDHMKFFTSYNSILSASYLKTPVEILSNALGAGTSSGGDPDFSAIGREFGETYIENVVGQSLPTSWAGWNRVIDPVKRTQAGNNLWERVRNKFYASIPGMSRNLEPAIDQKGQEIGNTGGNFAERLYYNKFAPYKKTKDTHDIYDEILMENKAAPKTQWQLKGALKGALGDNGFEWGKDFTGKDYTAAKKTYYGNYNQYTKDFADMPEYASVGQASKDSIYTKLDNLAMAQAKAEYFLKDGSADKWMKANPDTSSVPYGIEMGVYSKEQRVALEAQRLYNVSPAEFFYAKQNGLSGNREALYMMSVYDSWKDPKDPTRSFLDYLREEASDGDDAFLPYSAVGVSANMFKKTPDELAELEYKLYLEDGGKSVYDQADEYRRASSKEDREALKTNLKDTRDENKKSGSSKGKGKGSSGSKRRSSRGGSSRGSSSGSTITTDEQKLYEKFLTQAGKALSKKGDLPSASVKVNFDDDSALWERLMNSNKSSVEKLRRELGIK